MKTIKKERIVRPRTARLRTAIARYFLVKASNNGMFPNSEIKRRIIEEMVDAANAERTGIAIVPGILWLKRFSVQTEYNIMNVADLLFPCGKRS